MKTAGYELSFQKMARSQMVNINDVSVRFFEMCRNASQVSARWTRPLKAGTSSTSTATRRPSAARRSWRGRRSMTWTMRRGAPSSSRSRSAEEATARRQTWVRGSQGSTLQNKGPSKLMCPVIYSEGNAGLHRIKTGERRGEKWVDLWLCDSAANVSHFTYELFIFLQLLSTWAPLPVQPVLPNRGTAV